MSSLAPESALTYLRDELGLTIERIQLALASYSERPEERSELELAGRYLRQLRGALDMMEHRLGTRFVHEMVQLLDLVATGQAQDFEAAREAVLMAALRLEPFIACLERGDRDGVGVDLAGAVDQLRALRGKPPLSPAPSERPKAEPADLDRLLVRKLRPAYQRALARVVRGQAVPASLAQLLQVLEQIRDMAQTETPYRVWWTSCKLLRALKEGWIQPGPEVVPLLGKIDRKLREQVDLGKAAFGGEQALGLLTLIESKVRESAEGAAFFDDRSDYRPPAEGGLAPPPAPATDIDTLRQVAANMVDDISVAQDLVDRMAAGEDQPQDAVTDLGARLRTVASVLAMVNLNSSASLPAAPSPLGSTRAPRRAARSVEPTARRRS